MRIGIGIDTGGTCTDAVVYNFEEKRILLKFLSAHQLDLLSVVNQVFLKQVRCIQ